MKNEDLKDKNIDKPIVEAESNTKESDKKTKQKENKEKEKESSKSKKSSTKSKAEKMADENHELRLKLAEIQDKHLRLFSEFDNYRKRTAKERIELISSANEKLIEKLLPILDDIDRSIIAFETTDDLEAVKIGSILIFDKLNKVLQSCGLSEIISTGEEFDAEVFEAVANFPIEDKDMKNKVIDTTVKGYKLNEKIIRHPKVVVGC
ncbi:MAG: nucleotide exchange factor GrpE [Bacteroidales bacterium]|jgi:molecular chaperone GrpE